MVKVCSECGGVLSSREEKNQIIYKCSNCGKEKIVKNSIIETIDMSENANLDVIME